MSDSLPNNEEELVTLFFPDDNTKTISDLITYLKDLQVNSGYTACTETDVKTELKATFNWFSSWSF